MPDISLILAGLFGLIIVFFVLVKPLFLEPENTYFQTEPQDRDFSEATSLLEMIAELDTDFSMGKVSKEDYEALSLDYKHRYLKARSGTEQ